MAKISAYLDCRNQRGDVGILKLRVYHNGEVSYIPLNIKVNTSHWDSSKERVTGHPHSLEINSFIDACKSRAGEVLIDLIRSDKLSTLNIKGLKLLLTDAVFPSQAAQRMEKENEKKLFAERFLSFANSKTKSNTHDIYMHTYNRISAFVGDSSLKELRFDDITPEWLIKFDEFLSVTSPSKNARNIHFRNIRAVFNRARADKITEHYPFDTFLIRPVATRKRNLKVEDLRLLFDYPCEPHARKYVDIFKLMFMLIGINNIDLCNLKEIDKDGRINYYRAKTNRLYSVKVEPEALELIERYRGKNWLLYMLDHWRNPKDFMMKLNRVLKRVGPVKRVGRGGKKVYEPLFPEISSYWARHSWATIAASLDIPRDTIAHALGHGNNTITDIYIDFDQGKVDEANRKVLDWVLYGKRETSIGLPFLGVPDSVPVSIPDSVPVSVPDIVPVSVPDSVPDSVTYGVPYSVTYSVPYSVTYSVT